MAGGRTTKRRLIVQMVLAAILAGAAFGLAPGQALGQEVDLSQVDPEGAFRCTSSEGRVQLQWPIGDEREARLVLATGRTSRTIAAIEIVKGGDVRPIVRDARFTYRITVGSRQAPRGRPPEMSIWNTFFDNPVQRPYESFLSKLDPKLVRVATAGGRATVRIDGLSMGPFSGELELNLFADTPLIQTTAVVSTDENGRAILYDAGLVTETPEWQRFVWVDTRRKIQRTDSAVREHRRTAVRYRAMAAEGEGGSLVCFSAPHEFQFPRDYTDNLRFVWMGAEAGGEPAGKGMGIRQNVDGGGAFVPWFNAPPRSRQRLSVYWLLSEGQGDEALDEVKALTRGDRFKPLPGRVTFTSHWHMAIAVAALDQRVRGADPLPIPSLVDIFKEMGVQAVHLGEFHGDGHPKDPGPLRLRELESMFAECRRLSDTELLLIPGEEGNEYLGIKEEGKHPGHWMSLFPRPVYWIMRREEGQPFVEEDDRFGKVYRVGSTADMQKLLEAEGGLAWTAHPRIKASSWTPDIFRNEPFYLSDRFLGAAWKAMPADLSRDRLGERGLDLLSDMANWGQRKYLPGEVDVFKIDPTHELYGHMNVNYLELDRLPAYDDGWQPILDALRGGKFFTTTGEVLFHDFRVGGRTSGETLYRGSGETVEVVADLEWTFPPNFVEVISGNGRDVFRQRVDLADSKLFSQGEIRVKVPVEGRTWVRCEAWDVARNGAYTQPVWIDDRGP
jgi:hypothetical protein